MYIYPLHVPRRVVIFVFGIQTTTKNGRTLSITYLQFDYYPPNLEIWTFIRFFFLFSLTGNYIYTVQHSFLDILSRSMIYPRFFLSVERIH